MILFGLQYNFTYCQNEFFYNEKGRRFFRESKEFHQMEVGEYVVLPPEIWKDILLLRGAAIKKEMGQRQFISIGRDTFLVKRMVVRKPSDFVCSQHVYINVTCDDESGRKRNVSVDFFHCTSYEKDHLRAVSIWAKDEDDVLLFCTRLDYSISVSREAPRVCIMNMDVHSVYEKMNDASPREVLSHILRATSFESKSVKRADSFVYEHT